MQNSSTMSRSGYRVAAIILVWFVVVMAALVIFLLKADHSGGTHGPVVEDGGVGHIHGLGVDPDDGTLYVASHTGVFTLRDGQLERVADRWQDTMGFAVVGPKHFLASGHPDMREDLPAMLGLIESTDGAETWQPISLLGEADLHAIEPAGDTVFAIESSEGRLIASDDQREWRTIDSRPLLDLAAAPDGGQLLATTPQGDLLRYEQEGTPVKVDGAPRLTYVDWAGPEQLVGTTPGGNVVASTTGDVWKQVGMIVGEATALDAGSDAWHIATEAGIFASTDSGRTWKLLVETA